uniref:oleoyl-[acyl-carrier-protein] hydrolase n=1 Tax=Marmota marmota marmota TaxID=9994 RepID=A0A8C6AC45_MARMA
MQRRHPARTSSILVGGLNISGFQFFFNCLYPKPNAIFKLICFPWAGSGSTYFAKWGQSICDTLEVSCLRLAGRESRLEEPFAKDINHVVEEIIHALLPIIQDKPFAFFGHRYLNILKDSWGNFFTNSWLMQNTSMNIEVMKNLA